MSRTRILASLIVAATVVAACAASGGSPAASSPPAAASGVPAVGATVATTTSASFGAVLIGPNGLTLYTYSGDSANTSACTGSCASEWPPLTVPAGQQPTAGPGVTGSLTSLVRADGTTQLAYDGLPLYYWQGDAKPGDVTGDGIDGFSVAKVSGGRSAASAPPPSSSGGRYGY
jgi:predicted lipoprotein with Yx(FWY)xxD motif